MLIFWFYFDLNQIDLCAIKISVHSGDERLPSSYSETMGDQKLQWTSQKRLLYQATEKLLF